MSENDNNNTYFYEEDNYTSDIDTDNELNFPVNVATDKNKWRNQVTNYFFEIHK